MPAVIGTIGGILKQFFGLPFLFDAVVSWNEPIAKASLFIGAPLALVANLLAVTRIGFQRAEGKISTFLALEASPLVLFVLGMAFIVVALFWGHLFADGLACIRVVRAAC
ncbi:MAG: hypothetical protein HY257_01405 [Chloroflexi bacterium]|nr:hypothetical protein [Chloroflexota bacterium]